MKSRVASSTERGYGGEHRKTRRRLLPLAYGTDCALCGQVMTEDQPLDLDHSIPLSRNPASKADRVVHRRCNRAHGTTRPQPALDLILDDYFCRRDQLNRRVVEVLAAIRAA